MRRGEVFLLPHADCEGLFCGSDGTVIPKANYAPKQILTEAQLEKFLEAVRQDKLWYDFFYTELTTGLRRGEICGLRWTDFDGKTGRLKIRRAVTSRKGGGVKIGETKTETGTRTIQLQAAAKIDRQIGKTDAQMPPDEQPKHTDQSGFQPYKSKYRKSGTGGIYQLGDHLWEGKYSPRDADGKRIRRTLNAKTREECEEKLAKMIEEVKREIAEGREKMAEQSMT